MSSLEIIEVIRRIVQEELKNIRVAEIGVVTSIFPHSSESDKDNYECNVKLKGSDVELRRVPIATQHLGLASPPSVGDMVLVSFVNGDLNAPVVIGRLYNDEARPPVNNEGEVVYEAPYSKSSSARRFYLKLPSGMTLTVTDDSVEVKAGGTRLRINRNGDIRLEAKGDITIKAEGDLHLSAKNLKIKSDQDVSFDGRSMSVGLDKASLDVKQLNVKDTDFSLESQALLKLKSDGNLDIQGSVGNMEMKGPLSIKGAIVRIN
ncbi:MAG: hypothetical protein DRJ68_02335 [Thermoprotei archaeon]|nr:MAG: hypothetical protein DRJ62_04585 [Thermoprotei archaeon]RLF21954.1 MAG: hypothetical protein DRJ68_02335 [Thermoprotei archaeon]